MVVRTPSSTTIASRTSPTGRTENARAGGACLEVGVAVGVEDELGDPAQVAGEVLLGDRRAVAAQVEGVDVHVRHGGAAGHLAQVDPADQSGELGGPAVVGVEVHSAVGDQAGEAARTPHAHPAV